MILNKTLIDKIKMYKQPDSKIYTLKLPVKQFCWRIKQSFILNFVKISDAPSTFADIEGSQK